MIYLLLTILSAVTIAAILRYSEDRGRDRFVVAGFNYVVALLLSLILSPRGASSIDGAEVLFGVIVGVGFVAGFVAIMRAMNEIGMAVPATASRLSTLIPVVGSIALYDELPSPLQIVGIVVGVIAFVVLGVAQRRRQVHHGISPMGLWLLVAVFVISGCVDLAMKIAHESGAARGPFLLLVFGTACVVCATATVIGRRRIVLRDVVTGALLGVPNFAASYFLLGALGELDGVVVFPAMNASVVLGVSLLAVLLWREIPTPITAAGLALAACAVVLLGIG
jgi:drug/metabolite transporter (DMT)-like permease